MYCIAILVFFISFFIAILWISKWFITRGFLWKRNSTKLRIPYVGWVIKSIKQETTRDYPWQVVMWLVQNCNECQISHASGMVDEKWFLDKSRDSSSLISAMFGGIGLTKWFVDKFQILQSNKAHNFFRNLPC